MTSTALIAARAVPIVAWIDELREQPELLRGWCATFTDADQTTLAVLLGSDEPAALSWLESEVQRAGSTADILAVPVREAGAVEAVIASAVAVLSRRPDAAAHGLPVIGVAAPDQLRAAAAAAAGLLGRQAERVAELRAAWDCADVAGEPILRQPALLTGAGRIEFASGVVVGVERAPGFHSTYAYIDAAAPGALVAIGPETVIGNGASLCSSGPMLQLGARVRIGEGADVRDAIVGDDVSIGARAMVLPGVTIGDGAVVTAASVVTGPVRAGVVVAGNPARATGTAGFEAPVPAPVRPAPSPAQAADERPGAELVAWLRTRPWELVQLPPRVTAVTTMISEDERRLLYLLARDHFAGEGEIVDAGCFLGGSTIALAHGLADRAQPVAGAPIHSYDLFLVDHYAERTYGGVLGGLATGDSIEPFFRRQLGDLAERVVVHAGDICEERFQAPAEILFIDVAKSWAINDHVAREFLPRLIAGRSVLVQQDYVHEWAPWLHVTMELLADAFTYVGSMPHGSSVFVPRREVRADELPSDLMRDLPDDRKLELYDRSARRFEGEDRGIVECGRAYLLSQLGRRADAEAHLDMVRRTYQHPRVREAAPGLRDVIATAG